MPEHAPDPRRRFLLSGLQRSLAAAAGALPLLAAPARAARATSLPAPCAERGALRLSLLHTHTGERFALDCAADAAPPPDAMRALDHFLRDHYSGEVGRIDPALLPLLQGLQGALGRGGAFEIVSGFRGAVTNERLRRSGGGGVARHSLHLEGRALDLRLPGVALTDLRRAALALRAGGVGSYPGANFVHVDTGRVRAW